MVPNFLHSDDIMQSSIRHLFASSTTRVLVLAHYDIHTYVAMYSIITLMCTYVLGVINATDIT